MSEPRMMIDPIGPYDRTCYGLCPGCARHCSCPGGIAPDDRDGTTPDGLAGWRFPPAQIQMVGWVMLHLPNKFGNLTVSLPAKYLVSQAGDVRDKIKASYRIFDEDIVDRIIEELEGDRPSMKSYEVQRDDIQKLYLHSVEGYGKFIVIREKAAFEKRVDEFKKMLNALGKRMRELMNKQKDEAIDKLFDVLMDQWIKLEYCWWKLGDEEIDPRKVFHDDMSKEISKKIDKFIPSIKYPYFDLTLETRLDAEFRGRANATFRRWLEDNGKDLNWLLGTSGRPLPGEFQLDEIAVEEDE